MADDRILVRVRARRQEGRWRCGKQWPAHPVEAEVTTEQLAALEADTLLVVHRADGRNPAVPSVNSVQPGANKPPEPQAWDADHEQLERQRQELLRLDKQKADADQAERKAAADAERQRSEDRPANHRQNQQHSQHRR